jgi:hypothetical protein
LNWNTERKRYKVTAELFGDKSFGFVTANSLNS